MMCDLLADGSAQVLHGLQTQMWRKLLYSGFETCFGPSTQGAGIRYQNTSQIQILRHFDKKGARCKILRLSGIVVHHDDDIHLALWGALLGPPLALWGPPCRQCKINICHADSAKSSVMGVLCGGTCALVHTLQTYRLGIWQT